MNRYRRNAALWAAKAKHLSNEAFGMLTRLTDHYILTGAALPLEPDNIAQILQIPLVRPEADGTAAPPGTPPLASRELLVAMAVMAEFFKPFSEGGAVPRHPEYTIEYLRYRRARMLSMRMRQWSKAAGIFIPFDDAITFTATTFENPLPRPNPAPRRLHMQERPVRKASVLDEHPELTFGGGEYSTVMPVMSATIAAGGNGTLFADIDPTTARVQHQDLWMAAGRVLDYLNDLTGRHYRLMNPKGGATPNADFMVMRMREGYAESDLIAVAERQAKLWTGTKMEPYLRPKTLFNRTNFATYLAEVKDGDKLTPPGEGWTGIDGFDLGE